MGFNSLLALLLSLLQEEFGRTRPSSTAAETGVFRFSPVFIAVKTTLLLALGALFIRFSVGAGGFSAWGLIAVGLWCSFDGFRVALGLRSVVLADGFVTVTRAVGEKATWPLGNLVVVDAGDRMSKGTAMIPVRERASGRIAFWVPRDLPAWEVLVGQIPSIDRR